MFAYCFRVEKLNYTVVHACVCFSLIFDMAYYILPWHLSCESLSHGWWMTTTVCERCLKLLPYAWHEENNTIFFLFAQHNLQNTTTTTLNRTATTSSQSNRSRIGTNMTFVLCRIFRCVHFNQQLVFVCVFIICMCQMQLNIIDFQFRFRKWIMKIL